MKKILSILLISCFLLTGCGNGTTETDSTQSNNTEEDYVLDEEELLENGYTNIANVAYVKFEYEAEGEELTVYLVYMDNSPISSYYLMQKMVQKLYFSRYSTYEIVLTWDGKEYIYDNEVVYNDLNDEEFIDSFPADWREVLENRRSGIATADMISVTDGLEINKGVEELFADF